MLPGVLPGVLWCRGCYAGGATAGGALRGLLENRALFETGPKWAFAVDTSEAGYVGYVDCDLANPQVPRGEADISYCARIPITAARCRQPGGALRRSVPLRSHWSASGTSRRRRGEPRFASRRSCCGRGGDRAVGQRSRAHDRPARAGPGKPAAPLAGGLIARGQPPSQPSRGGSSDPSQCRRRTRSLPLGT